MTSLVVEATPWAGAEPPRSILAVRLQCLGDLVAVLPYLYQVREAHPEARLDLLTRNLYSGFIDTIPWIDTAIYLGRSWTYRQAMLSLVPLLPRLMSARYEVVLDLQGSRLTQRLRALLRPAAWTTFDRHSPRPAFERIRDTVDRAGLASIVHRPGLGPFDVTRAEARLRAAGWRPEEEVLVLLNPGATIATRQWSTERWVELAELFAHGWTRPVRLLMLGIDRMKERADRIAAAAASPVLNLVGRTEMSELGPMVSLVQLTVTEDGGLSHLSSALGVPTLALLPGGSADVWVQHVGDHVADMIPAGVPCAPCIDTVCRFNDMRCARWAADDVFRAATELYERVVGARESARARPGA